MHLPAVAATLEECAVATALPTADYVLDTPDAALCETERAQPAIFALSVGLARTLLDEGVRPARFAGHSVGHFAALAASGALGLGDAARLVARRGQLMAAAGRRRPGGMGIVHGLDAWTVAEVLSQCNLPLWPANLNLPRQTAVSGERAGARRGPDRVHRSRRPVAPAERVGRLPLAPARRGGRAVRRPGGRPRHRRAPGPGAAQPVTGCR